MTESSVHAQLAVQWAHMYNRLEMAKPVRQPFTKSPLDIAQGTVAPCFQKKHAHLTRLLEKH